MILLYTAIYSIVLAWLNSVPVRSQIRDGAKKWESNEFHQANAVVKTMWAVGYTWFAHLPWLMVIILWLVQWLCFDPALNLWIGHKWHYIGETAKTDRLLRSTFGNRAGQIKALIVTSAIIILFIILY